MSHISNSDCVSKPMYPSLYQCADMTSLKAQKTFLRLNKFYLWSLVFAAITGSLTTVGPQAVNRCLCTASATFLIVGLIILWVTRGRQDDKIWFDGRAVAESVKTAAWRFMMRVRPFHEDSNAERLFLDKLKEIREARPNLARDLAAVMSTSGSAITGFMKQKRSAPLDERRDFYVSNRVREQKSWYKKKAQSNAQASTKWFWVITVLQVVVVVLAIVQAASGGFGFNPIPIVTTCVAAIATWNQMKRHDELAQSYTLAAQELEELEALADNQISESDFSQFVEQVENSISREHTMWCARRNIHLSRNDGGSKPTTGGSAGG